jgi:hypothetical protein
MFGRSPSAARAALLSRSAVNPPREALKQDESRGGNSVSAWLTIKPPNIVMPSGCRNSGRRHCQHQWQRGKQRRHRRHHDRPEAQQTSLGDRVARAFAALRSASSAKSIIMIAFFFTIPIRG